MCYTLRLSAYLSCSAHDANTNCPSASSSLQILIQILVSDYSDLRTRGLFAALATAPFLVNGLLGAWLGSTLLERVGWRYGCKFLQVPFSTANPATLTWVAPVDAIFAALVPTFLVPLVTTLLWAERRVTKLALIPGQDIVTTPRLVRETSSSPLTPVGVRHSSSYQATRRRSYDSRRLSYLSSIAISHIAFT